MEIRFNDSCDSEDDIKPIYFTSHSNEDPNIIGDNYKSLNTANDAKSEELRIFSFVTYLPAQYSQGKLQDLETGVYDKETNIPNVGVKGLINKFCCSNSCS